MDSPLHKRIKNRGICGPIRLPGSLGIVLGKRIIVQAGCPALGAALACALTLHQCVLFYGLTNEGACFDSICYSAPNSVDGI
jgi:hypothetical protein